MTAWATVSRTVLPERLLLMMFFSRGSGGLPGLAVQDDRLLLGHLGDRGARSFLADAAALEAAVGHQVGAPQRRPVDVDVAGIDLAGEPHGVPDVAGEDARAEAEGRRVRGRDRGIDVGDGAHGDGWPEELLLAEGAVEGD